MEDKIKRLIKETVFKCFSEKIKEREQLLTEMWSYSDNMDDMMDYVYGQLSKHLYKAKLNKIDYGIGLHSGTIDNLTIFGIEGITFEYYVYECMNDNICRYVIENAYNENNYSEEDKHLVVTFFTVLGQLIEEPSNKNLSHELEHILQISMGMKNNPKYSQLTGDAYKKASRVIHEMGNDNSFDCLIAWLIYYSEQHEQDAFMNEYYQDLRNMKQFIRDENSETHIRYMDYKNKCEIFKNNINNKNMLNALSEYKLYGYNVNNFTIMIDKGLHRFKKKMNNVEKHFKDVVKTANESHLRLGPIKNGSLIIL